MFPDPRTWGTLLYQLLMLPLGTAYFTIAVTALAVSLSFVAVPLAVWFGLFDGNICLDGDCSYAGDLGVLPGVVLWPLSLLIGIVLLFATLHLARGIGSLHAQLAKALLVRWG